MFRKPLLLVLTGLFLFLGACAPAASLKTTEGDCPGKAQASGPSLIVLDNSDKD